MTKIFYIHDEISQIGPFDINELKARAITKKTAVWFKGLLTWTSAGDIDELKEIFEEKDSPLTKNNKNSSDDTKETQNPLKRKRKPGLKLALLLIGFLTCAFGFIIINDPNAIPGLKFNAAKPEPKIVSSNADGRNAGLYNSETTVYTSVLNEGADGNVLVTFLVKKGDDIFDKQKTLFIPAGKTIAFEATFDQINYLDGKSTYSVEARAE